MPRWLNQVSEILNYEQNRSSIIHRHSLSDIPESVKYSPSQAELDSIATRFAAIRYCPSALEQLSESLDRENRVEEELTPEIQRNASDSNQLPYSPPVEGRARNRERKRRPRQENNEIPHRGVLSKVTANLAALYSKTRAVLGSVVQRTVSITSKVTGFLGISLTTVFNLCKSAVVTICRVVWQMVIAASGRIQRDFEADPRSLCVVAIWICILISNFLLPTPIEIDLMFTTLEIDH